MTEKMWRRKQGIALFSLIAVFTLFALLHMSKVQEGVLKGLFLAGQVILPSLFPFFVFSRLLLDAFPLSENAKNGIFSRIFHLPEEAFLPFILGFLAGFPVGGKSVLRLYQKKVVNKEEAERMLAFMNNTGPAFLFGGIGTLFHNVKMGIFLFVLQFVTASLTGWFIGLGHRTEKKPHGYLATERPAFADIVTDSSFSALTVTGFIVIFQVFMSLLSIPVSHPATLSVIAAILEISTAAKCISALSFVPIAEQMALMAFAVSFSGISVFSQTAALLRGSGLSLKKAFFMKLFQGLLSAFFAALLTPLLF